MEALLSSGESPAMLALTWLQGVVRVSLAHQITGLGLGFRVQGLGFGV